MTTSELLSEWMTNEQRERIKTQTYARYQGLIDQHIAPALGDCDITAVTRRQITDFLADRRHDGNLRHGCGLSPVSVNIMLTVLNMAFEYACDRELLEVNPCTRVKRIPNVAARYVDAFTKEEQRRLEATIEAADDDRYFGIILCLYTGLRIGELLSLEWSDLSEDCRMLTVSKTVYRCKDEDGKWQTCTADPKTASSFRCIPLPDHLVRELRKRKKSSASPYIVTNQQGERMATRSYQTIFAKLTVLAGVRKLNFHAIRHTFATRALENGMDIKTLSELLGHGNASITLNCYTHSMMDTKIKMMNKMTRLR